MKSWHRWMGLLSLLPVAVLALTGLLLSHPRWLGQEVQTRGLSIAVHPFQARILWKGTRDGLFRSNDGGRSWEEVPIGYPPQEVVGLAVAPTRPVTLYSVERWGSIFRSLDGGIVWERLPHPFDPQETAVPSMSVSAALDGTLYLQTASGLWRLAKGKSWEALEGMPAARGARDWYRTLLDLHTGYFFGRWFVYVYDFAAVSLVILIITGLFLWRKKEALWRS